MIKLETQRLLLRPFEENDYTDVQKYAGNSVNVKYMIWGPNDEENTKIFIRDCIDEINENPRTKYDFAVILKDTGELIGGCGIYVENDSKQASLGWIIRMDHWKKGYGTEFASALLEFGFEKLGMHRIYATCFAENYGSYRVMERNGMRREGHYIKSRYGRVYGIEKWSDEYLYAILKEEWEQRKGG